MLAIAYVGNALCVAIVWAFSPLLLNFYNISGDARQIAKNCLNLCLAVQFFTYPLSFGMPAVLKATSDVRYVMVCAIASMLIMRVGLCYLLTCDWVGAHLGAMGLWIGMVTDWVVRSLLFGGRVLSGRWKKASGLLQDKKPAEEEQPDKA
jgi:Na+-driven multidrug efflux pump